MAKSSWKEPQMKSELAYLLGAYLSDGTLCWGSYSKDPHPQWNVKDESFADCISVALAAIGSPHSFKRYPSQQGLYCVREKAGGKLGRWLDDTARGKERLPEIPRGLVRPLVAGLMDGDGCISMRDQEGIRTFCLSFDAGKGFVPDFYQLLREIGVKQGKLRKVGLVTEWRWTINIESFLAAGLNFAMPRKQARLALWCCQVQRTALQHGHSNYLRKAAIAKWWMREVYSQDLGISIPIGQCVLSKDLRN